MRRLTPHRAARLTVALLLLWVGGGAGLLEARDRPPEARERERPLEARERLLEAQARSPGAQGGSPEAAAEPGLPPAMAEILAHPSLEGARVGMLVADAETGEVLVAHGADRLMAPASVNKVFTAAAALWRLGPSFTWETPLAVRGSREDGVIRGDLWALGRGAPDIVEEQLWLAARAIARRGITRIDGDLVVDDRFFDARRAGEGWPGGSQVEEAYHAPISALMANYAARRDDDEWRAVEDPALHFGRRLEELMGLAGVRLEGRVRRPRAAELRDLPASPDAAPDDTRRGLPEELDLLYTLESEPLGRVVLDLNKFSNNIVAETLLKTLGAVEYGPPGTATKGLALVARFLDEELGIPLNSYVQADGSGLSRLDRFTPRQVTTLLLHAWDDFHLGPEFVSSLKLGGLDGWNPRRFRDPPLVGELRLKSGHIRGVNTLTGYVHAASGRTLAFCLMVNDHRAAQWQVDDRMAELSRAIVESF